MSSGNTIVGNIRISDKTNAYSTDPSRFVRLNIYQDKRDINNNLVIEPKIDESINAYKMTMIAAIVFIFFAITIYCVAILIPDYKIQMDKARSKRFLGGAFSKKKTYKMCTIV